MIDYETLKIIWWILVAALLIGFALTDGYDMGAGTLLPFIGKTDTERRVYLNVLAPHWDGNQVWFITGAASLFAAWPFVYAMAFNTFFIVLLATLWALLLRPGAFEYRGKIDSPRWRRNWDWALFFGSAIPAVIFGAAFGNLLLGVHFDMTPDHRPIPMGPLLGQFHPFALLCGIVGLALLTTHGGTYLALRTDGVLRARAARAAKLFAAIVIATFVAAGFWLHFGIDGLRIVSMPSPETAFSPLAKTVTVVKGAWLDNFSQHAWTSAAPALGVLGAIGVLAFAGRGNGWAAFGCSALMVVGVILTAGIALFPFILPSVSNPNASLTIWDATSSHLTLNLMFWAVVIFLPIIFAYTIWAYRVMWRRLSEEDVRKETHMLY